MSDYFRDPRRAKSDAIAFQAERAWSSGKHVEARKLFAEAAELEESLAREINKSSQRLRSMWAISAVALWYKSAQYERAKNVAYFFLGSDGGLTPGGKRELEHLVERCSREAALEDVAKNKNMVPVEVKLDGGRVKVGIAPAGAARDRSRAVTMLLTRSAELAAGLAFREHGGSELGKKDQLHIFEAPALAASYGMRFYVGTGSKPVKGAKTVTSENVVRTFLSLATAAAAGPEAIRKAVPDQRYAQAFIAGFIDLAPDGEDIESVECFAPTWKMTSERTLFEPSHRVRLRSTPERDTADRKVRARVVAVSLPRSSIELEVVDEKVGEPETIDGSVVAKSKRHLRGLRIDDVYDFDLAVKRVSDPGSGQTRSTLEIRDAINVNRARREEPEDNRDRAPSEPFGKVVRRWSKKLTATDALQNDGNQRPYIQLTNSDQPIDHASWFRHDLLVDEKWIVTVGATQEEGAYVEAQVVIKGADLGTHALRFSYLAARAQHHNQPTTRLHWEGDVRYFLERNDCTSEFLILERDKSGRHRLTIASERPDPIVAVKKSSS